MGIFKHIVPGLVALGFAVIGIWQLNFAIGEDNPPVTPAITQEYWVGNNYGYCYYRSDGKKALFRGGDADTSKISICDITDEGKQVNDKELVSINKPDFIGRFFVTSDGKRIVYDVCGLEGHTLWGKDTSGNSKQLYKIKEDGTVDQLSFSPDGKQVILCVDKRMGDGKYHSYIMVTNVDGSNIRRFAKSQREAHGFIKPPYYLLQFIPNTSKIIFLSLINSKNEYKPYIAEIGKEDKTEIKNDGYINMLIVSPDGKKIAHVGNEPGDLGGGLSGWVAGKTPEIWFVMNINGSDKKKLDIAGNVLGFSKDSESLFYLDSKQLLSSVKIKDAGEKK